MQSTEELPEELDSIVELAKKFKEEKAAMDATRFEVLCTLISKRRDAAGGLYYRS